ncbi:helix-turn-helix domain-containing protein [Psychrobacillus sp. FSL K6-1415]|uniref:helix-turn-helix domain-containing protein n=1 Tax=Psychrobacillus sp. FSL K6-1415 TaxID=2921544 RepID=UPI0030F9E2AE
MNSTSFKALRIREGKTQAAFAEMLGVSESTVAQIETNKRPISARVKVKLAQKFKMDDELVNFFAEVRKYQ